MPKPIDTDKPAKPSAMPVCPVGEKQCGIIDELIAAHEQNHHLSQQLHTDLMTGIYNYRFFIQAMEQEIERTHRTGTPTAIIMIDIDHFKRINDDWGHDTGNQALVHITKIMHKTVRRLDICCRYGGEEFVIILPSTSLLRSLQIAERVRYAIEISELNVGNHILKMTVSMGVNIYTPEQIDSVEDFIKHTDRYLYQAKNAGRNRICHTSKEFNKKKSLVNAAEKAALFNMDNDEKG